MIDRPYTGWTGSMQKHPETASARMLLPVSFFTVPYMPWKPLAQTIRYCVRNAGRAGSRRYKGMNRIAEGYIPLLAMPPSSSGNTSEAANKCLAFST